MNDDLRSYLKLEKNDAGLITRLYCTYPNCSYKTHPGSQAMKENESKWDFTIKDHAGQHDPGRAPDLRRVEYEVSTDPCTVCPRGEGDIVMENANPVPSELVCLTCGTTWDADGEGGTRKKLEPGDIGYINSDQLVLEI